MAFRFGYVFPGVCSASGSLTALPQPGIGHHLMVLLLSTNACNSHVAAQVCINQNNLLLCQTVSNVWPFQD